MQSFRDFLNYKSKLLFVFLTLNSSLLTLSAQSHVMDSLQKVLKTEKDDTNKVNTLMQVSDKLYLKGKYDTALTYALEAEALAERLESQKHMAFVLGRIGLTYDYLGNYPKAIEYDNKSLEKYKELGDKSGVATNLGHIGIIYAEQANYPQALDYYFKALEMDQQLGFKKGLAMNYGNIGIIYKKQGNMDKSFEYYSKALAINQEIKDDRGIAINLGNIGIYYKIKGNYPKALECYLKALDLNRKVGYRNGISMDLGNIGGVYEKEGNFPKALEYDFSSIDLSRQIKEKHGIALYQGNVGRVYTEQKKYKESKIYFDSALALSKSIGEREITENVYNGLFLLDSATGNYKQGLEDYKNYIIYRDSLINEVNTKKTVQTEMNFEFEQKQAAEKAEQDKKDAIADQERKKQVVIRDAFMGGFALTLALAFFIFRGYRQKQKANLVISNQKAVVEQKQKEILDSIHYAQRIQKALLAAESMLNKNLPEHFVMYKPKDIVSGDFYWATTKGEAFYLAVCDSTGHGVPGAFMSLLNISFLNEAITEKGITQPNKVFNHVRKRLIENISQDGGQDGMDGVLLAIGGHPSVISYSAAYNAPIVIRNNEIIELNTDKMPIGSSPKNDVPFSPQTFDLQKGDTLYLFTDGYADQFGGDKAKKFMHRKFLEKLLAISHQPLAIQKDTLEQTFDKWKGMLEQVDDVLVIGIRV